MRTSASLFFTFAFLIGLNACASNQSVQRGAPSTYSSDEAGSLTPVAAVTRMLKDAEMENIVDFGHVWGTEAGPASSTMETNSLVMRTRIMMCALSHTSSSVGKEKPISSKRTNVEVSLKLHDLERGTGFTTVQGPSGRWYVETFDIAQLNDLCTARRKHSTDH